jgi:hypothetical protein
VGTDPPRTVRLDLPAWLWGRSVEDYLREAGLRVVRTAHGGGQIVEADERGAQGRPGLITCDDLAGAGLPDRYDRLNAAEAVAPTAPDPEGRRLVDSELERLVERTGSGGGLPSALVLHQLQISSAPSSQAAAVVRAALDDTISIRFDGGEQAFPRAALHLVRRRPAILHRAQLPAVLLRLEHDPAMRQGDLSAVNDALARGELVFAASGGLSQGLVLLDAYLAPALGALTPFVWAIPAARASGTVLISFGHAVAGASGDAAEPLQLLPSRGPEESRTSPVLPPGAASAALTWWCRRLDKAVSTLTDPAVHAGPDGAYRPEKHLHAILSVEQLFRRVGSIQRADRDSDARHVLLFTVLDTLERLNGRSLVDMCTLSFAEKARERVAASMPAAAASVLLPAADRAVAALKDLQAGFYLPQQLGADRVEFADSDGARVSLPLPLAAAEYMRLLRNATHGHGSNRRERQALTNTLLVQHDGHVPHDLALLGYLYLLELLAVPPMLRRTLYAAGSG